MPYKIQDGKLFKPITENVRMDAVAQYIADQIPIIGLPPLLKNLPEEQHDRDAIEKILYFYSDSGKSHVEIDVIYTKHLFEPPEPGKLEFDKNGAFRIIQSKPTLPHKFITDNHFIKAKDESITFKYDAVVDLKNEEFDTLIAECGSSYGPTSIQEGTGITLNKFLAQLNERTTAYSVSCYDDATQDTFQLWTKVRGNLF